MQASAAVQVQSATFAEATIPQVIGARIREPVDFNLLRAGTLAGAAGLAIAAAGVEIDIVTTDLGYVCALDAKGALTLVVKQAAGGTIMLSAQKMRRARVERDLLRVPFTQTVTFVQEGDVVGVSVG